MGLSWASPQERGEGCAGPAGLVGVDLHELAVALDGWFWTVVLQEHAGKQQDVFGPGTRGEEPAFWQRAVVAGRQDQVLSAQAAIGTRRADVDHPTAPGIIDEAQKFRRHFQHHGPLGEVEDAEGIDRV